jgi:hypothetical protein
MINVGCIAFRDLLRKNRDALGHNGSQDELSSDENQ